MTNLRGVYNDFVWSRGWYMYYRGTSLYKCGIEKFNNKSLSSILTRRHVLKAGQISHTSTVINGHTNNNVAVFYKKNNIISNKS